MKKIISLIIALLLCVGLLGTVAFAEEEEQSDVIRFEQVKSKKSDNGLFTLTTNAVDGAGWYGGYVKTLKITAANGLTITRIEAEIGSYYKFYSDVGVSGTAVKENSPSKNGDIVTVSQINSSEFSFTGGSCFIQFKNIKVYYTGTHTHIFDDNYVCACGIKGCGIEGHVLENGLCKFCDYIDESKHEHIFDDDNNCACGVKGCDIGAHSYKYYCEFCGEEAPENLPAETTGLGSTLSQGNVAIICSVAGIALGLVGGLLLGRKKKKPALASGTDNTDEE